MPPYWVVLCSWYRWGDWSKMEFKSTLVLKLENYVWGELLCLDNNNHLKYGCSGNSECLVDQREDNFWMDPKGEYLEDGIWKWKEGVPEQREIKNWRSGNFHKTGLSQRPYGKEYLSLIMSSSLAIIILLLPRQQHDNNLPKLVLSFISYKEDLRQVDGSTKIYWL